MLICSVLIFSFCGISHADKTQKLQQDEEYLLRLFKNKREILELAKPFLMAARQDSVNNLSSNTITAQKFSVTTSTIIIANTSKITSANSIFELGEIYSYPNPAKNGKNPTIHIKCGIADKINIRIYDMSGKLLSNREIRGNTWKLINGNPVYEYTWNTSNIPSGVYPYTIKAEKSGEKPITAVRKLALIK